MKKHVSDDLKFRQENQGYVGILLLGAAVLREARRDRSNKRDPGISLGDTLFELMGPTFKRDPPKFRKSATIAFTSIALSKQDQGPE